METALVIGRERGSRILRTVRSIVTTRRVTPAADGAGAAEMPVGVSA